MSSIFEALYNASSDILNVLFNIIRFTLPILSAVILVRCIRSLWEGHDDPETWAYLCLPNGARIELPHWENIIGRAASSDVVLDYPTLSRIHAAVIRDDKGHWTLHDLGSKSGVVLNGKMIEEPARIKNGDLVNLGGVDTIFIAKSLEEERKQAKRRSSQSRSINPGVTLGFLTEFILLLTAEFCITANGPVSLSIPLCFGILIAVMWTWYFITKSMKRTGYEVETLGFYLSAIGFSVVASSDPDSLFKYALLLIAGIIVFALLGWFLRDLDRAKKLRWPIAAAGILFLAVNLLIAGVTNGAKNWISIGGFSLQPSEFVKLCFIFAGAATLDRLFARRNLLMFIAFSGVCVGALALMSDFGTAVVFFVTYLVIAFIRSGDLATVFLSAGGAVLAGIVAITAKPYIASRFATWGNAWEAVNDSGYQQVRAMSAAASGGLFGGGAGNGWLQKIFAADTDMVFALVSEELGLLIALSLIAAIIILTLFVIKAAKNARSSFYVIGSCAAVTIFLTQIILNVFGSMDIIPFTGVTFPFVSRGGSSLIACWGLMAFVKAADTRQNASFIIKLPKKVKKSKARQVSAVEKN